MFIILFDTLTLTHLLKLAYLFVVNKIWPECLFHYRQHEDRNIQPLQIRDKDQKLFLIIENSFSIKTTLAKIPTSSL